VTPTELIGWGLAALLWLGVTAGAVALALAIAIYIALTVRAFRK
jgi:hypothetical protein